MISYGHMQLDITQEELDSLPFSDYFACYTQYGLLEKYYNEHNSSVWQIFEESPEWVHHLGDKVPLGHSHHVVSVVKIDPGQTVPHHLDKHFKVKEEFGNGETARYLIFLQDWKRGHYFEIQDQPFVKWKQGDWIKFGPDDWHLAGNMGDEPFYSAQVTVLYK